MSSPSLGVAGFDGEARIVGPTPGMGPRREDGERGGQLGKGRIESGRGGPAGAGALGGGGAARRPGEGRGGRGGAGGGLPRRGDDEGGVPGRARPRPPPGGGGSAPARSQCRVPAARGPDAWGPERPPVARPATSADRCAPGY